jgi:hypothetical protein
LIYKDRTCDRPSFEGWAGDRRSRLEADIRLASLDPHAGLPALMPSGYRLRSRPDHPGNRRCCEHGEKQAAQNLNPEAAIHSTVVAGAVEKR